MTTLERQAIRQPSPTPTTKVAASGTAGAISVVLVFVLGKFNVEIPGDVGSAITVLFSVASGYLVHERTVLQPPDSENAADE
ncbi:hypothetical protein [Mycobacteroides chelonae]|jgi:hypothetical protein|uniref:Holin n=1 Tax=Mycobacteroides chelonae TaxID=1774 RepID=A0AB73LYF4_MYCCH|nr:MULTISPECIES: hypothetical protein [Mycobacteroides]KRQ22098.1 hypothetical protein AOT86_20540 [Mycobacteroides sp. H072]KRQ30774.1 hypothetical protein AOT84_23870 [Mycobacteroides sp. H002]KRQ51474.1 hypothetical protein AOT85_11720 [Mycobacteroides sp. H054]KRQ69848.1 hypothetical protein AOT83_13705 [Mycobacteroides sp. H001]MBF9318988.1 hypothetical protein [Mycobacteroides chelonae]